MLQYFHPRMQGRGIPLPGKLSWSTAQAKSEAQGIDVESGEGASSAWLPAESSVGKQKRVDQESRKGVRQGKKNHRCPKFPQFYQKIFHDSSCDFSPKFNVIKSLS